MNFFQNMSLKYKLILLILSVTLISLMIGFAVNIFREYESLKEKILNEGIKRAEQEIESFPELVTLLEFLKESKRGITR